MKQNKCWKSEPLLGSVYFVALDLKAFIKLGGTEEVHSR